MEKPQINVKIIGPAKEDGEVLLEDLRDLCASLGSALRATEEVITNNTPHIKYRIIDLDHGSASLTIEAYEKGPTTNLTNITVDLFRSTIRSLEQGSEIDPRISLFALESYKQFASLFHRRALILLVGAFRLTSQFIANIDRLLGIILDAEGTVSGQVERINVHGKYEFAIFPPTYSHGITCHFPEDLFPLVCKAIKYSVTVTGTLHYAACGAFPARVTAKSILIHPKDQELPTLSSLRGIFSSSATDNLSSTEFIRSIRDEQI
jgi:hypothetical protein